MKKLESIAKLESWIDSYLNFEKTPKKNIFWLDTMKFFCEKFGHPENAAPCFHVAGSKGKGSISTFIASILDEAGYKTGLYTSPHILDFIERVSSVRGPFEDQIYDKAVEEIMKGVQSIKTEELPGQRPITWFELVTLFSFLVFRQAKTDYSIFEVGLGGRLDSTNVVNPVCECIGPIELEHTEFLGDTVEKIAYEKGGIIKENSTVIIARQKASVRKVFEKIAEEKHARAIFVEDTIDSLTYEIKNISDCIKNNTVLDKNNDDLSKDCLLFHTSSQKEVNIPLMNLSFSSKIFKRPIHLSPLLPGAFQAENAALAAIAVKTVLPNVSEDVIEKGLSKARLPGRFEILRNPFDKKSGEAVNEKSPFLILDGAHTLNSVKFTMETTEKVFGQDRNKILLFACAADKDAKDIAPLFKDKFTSVFLTKPGNVKAADLDSLKKAFDQAEISYQLDEDFEKQIKKALTKASAENSILLVTGSFYLIAEVKKILIKLTEK
ncbi:MAG: bifunctional folylpolyglutamate synthase/dihydrofolate synthase [Treponema sp.]|nr:bifunctional folylpolyglutamate synthase/dihydrofolate synthase [Treponema sp.]